MPDVITSILCAFAASLIACALISILLRVLKNIAPVLIFIFGIGTAEVVAIGIGLYATQTFYFWPATAVVSFMGICNFFVFSSVYKSLSLTMLSYLKNAPDSTVSSANLTENIVEPSIYERMDLLVDMGLVQKQANETYVVTQKGEKTLRQITSLQTAFDIKTSGLYTKVQSTADSHADQNIQTLKVQ